MIKINLLPRTINQKAILRNTAMLFGFFFVVIVAGGLAYGNKLRADVQDMEGQAASAEALKKQVEDLQAQAKAKRDSITPIKQKLDFIAAVLDYNKKYPALYEQVAKWTYDKVSLSSIQCDGKQLTMQARVKSLDDLGRYLLNMYRASDLFSEVKISQIPGYGSIQAGSFSMNSNGGFNMPMGDGGQIAGSQANLAGMGAISTGVDRTAISSMIRGNWINFTVTCVLKKPIEEPKFAGAADPNAAGGQPGVPGASPMPGGPMPGGPMPGGPGPEPPM